MKEFYANLKKGLNDIHSPMHELVFVRDNLFAFSPILISSILSTKLVLSNKTNELDLRLDMNVVIIELIGSSILIWPDLNVLSSALLIAKYSILHKIAIANWMPKFHISTISKDPIVLLYAVGTNVSFDMANVIFQVIISYVEAETTVGGLPFPSLIHELLTV